MLKVKILSHTPNPEEVIASAAKLCYSSVGVNEIMDKQDNESIQKFIKRLASIKHLSPFEHASFTFAIEGVSRSLTHQLVRHRIASYSQQSQRYVKENEFDYIIPPAIKNNKNAERIFIEQMESAQKAYDDLVIELMVDKLKKTKEYPAWCSTDLQLKNPSALRLFLDLYRDKFKETYQKLEKEAIEDARYVFPNATETKIVVTMNARSLMHFFTLRCCNRAQWEIRQLADQMLKEVIQLAPAIFMNSGAPCTYGKCTEGAMSCGVVRTLENIVGKDIVNGIELSENLANEEI